MPGNRSADRHLSKYSKLGIKFAAWCGVLEVDSRPVAPTFPAHTVRGPYTALCTSPEAKRPKTGRVSGPGSR